jgi:hypothetical protein
MAKKSNKQTQNQLLAALEFCSVASERLGTPNETHISLRNFWAIQSNNIVSCGAQIVEDIVCCPHTLLMIEALSKCDDAYSLTQLDNGRLSIKSGKFKAVIPYLEPLLLPDVVPDPQMAPLSNAFKDAVEAVGVLASETALDVITASVLMAGPSVIATNRMMILEYWHGLDLPSGVPLPKQFITALAKQKKNLSCFGYSNNSATFYFEDGSWIKTQLYNEQWPDVGRILNRDANLQPINPDFFTALEAVAPFSEDGNIYSDSNLLLSHSNAAVGASHECSNIPKGFIYPIKQLMIMKPYVKQIDFMANGFHDNSYCLVFQGDNMRGVISGRQRQ